MVKKILSKYDNITNKLIDFQINMNKKAYKWTRKRRFIIRSVLRSLVKVSQLILNFVSFMLILTIFVTIGQIEWGLMKIISIIAIFNLGFFVISSTIEMLKELKNEN